MTQPGPLESKQVSVAVAISEPGLRQQTHQALRALPLSLLGDVAGSGIAELASEIGRMQPDILLLGLPGLPADSSEAVRQIRASAGAPRVIAIHNAADPDIILHAMRAGASEFLYPPFERHFTEALERVAGECAREDNGRRSAGQVFAFLSVRGACGATTLACHTAAYLRQRTKKLVLLADMDFCAGNASIMMQANPRYTIQDALDNLNRLDLTLWKALVTSTGDGVDLIGAPPEPTDFSGQARTLAILTRFWRSQYDYTIADFGHGLTPTACSLINLVDGLLLVTTDELPALRTAKQALRTLAKHNVGANRLKLVINRMPKRAKIQVAELERIMDFPVYAAIPNDHEAFAEAYAEPRLIEPESAIGQPMAFMADKLAGVSSPVQKKAKRAFLFG
jgi:pilus assembly protein CpaE